MANKKRTATPAQIAARVLNLAPVRNAAFASGQSRSTLIAAVFSACGKRPLANLYNATKLEIQIGLMGAALARKGDNREPETLMEHCRDRLTNYAGFGGTGSLGKKAGRRTQVEELAYGSARVSVSSIMKEAGVTVKGAEARGGDTSKTRSPGGKVKAERNAKTDAANDSKPVIRRYQDAGELNAYVALQSKAMLSTINRNAKLASPALKSAVADFHAAVKAL